MTGVYSQEKVKLTRVSEHSVFSLSLVLDVLSDTVPSFPFGVRSKLRGRYTQWLTSVSSGSLLSLLLFSSFLLVLSLRYRCDVELRRWWAE